MKVTDRTFLELAAIAADLPVGGWALDTSKGMRLQNIYGDFVRFWNPLESDADNRQLQVKLRLSLIPCESGGWVVCSYDPETHEEKWLVADLEPNRAVVSAAAIIGQKMK